MPALTAFSRHERPSPPRRTGWTSVTLSCRVPLKGLAELPHENVPLNGALHIPCLDSDDVEGVGPTVTEVTLAGTKYALLQATFQLCFQNGKTPPFGQIEREFEAYCRKDLGLPEASGMKPTGQFRIDN